MSSDSGLNSQMGSPGGRRRRARGYLPRIRLQGGAIAMGSESQAPIPRWGVMVCKMNMLARSIIL